jgi:hypothetical protein
MQAYQSDPAKAEAQWRTAREAYRASAKSFQVLKNMSGAIFATGNAALLTAQLGEDARALKVRCGGIRMHCASGIAAVRDVLVTNDVALLSTQLGEEAKALRVHRAPAHSAAGRGA